MSPPTRPSGSQGACRCLPWLLAAVLAVGLSSAPPAGAAWMLPPSPYRAKDFTIVKRDGWYHVFYIRTNVNAPYDSTEVDLGHAISRDLYTWQQQPAVLTIRPDRWDSDHIWSPSIVQVDSVYYMFYTGITDQQGVFAFHQRIGVAISTDLMTWNRFDDPVYDCSRVPWTDCDPSQNLGGEFRDPFVMPDPRVAGGWLMYYTARPAFDTGSYVVGAAVSGRGLMKWDDLGPVMATYRTYSNSSTVESPHLFRHGNLWYLFFTGGGGQPIRFATSPDLFADGAAWTQRGALGTMVGQSSSLWFASEYLEDGTHAYLAFVNYDRVDIREIAWGSDWSFGLFLPPFFHVYAMSWAQPTVYDGQQTVLTIESVNWFNYWRRIEVVEVDPDGSEELLSNAVMGLPDSVSLNAAAVHVPWTAHAWPDADATPGAEIVVRLADRTATTPILHVLPVPMAEIPGHPGSPDPRRIPLPIAESAAARAAGVGVRALARSPLTTGPVLLVDLQQAEWTPLDVFDVQGRHVRNLAARTLPRGATLVPWDGKDGAGMAVLPGVYFARLVTPTLQGSARVLVTR